MKDLRSRIPVEPLDDERLTNIERRLVVAVSDMRAPAARAPRRLLAFAAIAMAVAVAGVIGWQLRGRDVTAPAPRAADEIALLSGGDKSTLDLGDAEVASTPGTEARVVRAAKRTDVVLAAGKPGKLELHVDHDPGRLFVVRAGDIEIEDVGTRFSVDYDGKSKVEVRVTEGEVKVKRAGQETNVSASNAWTTDDGLIAIAKLEEKSSIVAVAHPDVDPAGEDREQLTTGSNAGSAGTARETGSGTNAGSGSRPKTVKSNARKAILEVPLDPQDVGTNDPAAAAKKYVELMGSVADGDARDLLLYSLAVAQHRLKQDAAALKTIAGPLNRRGGDSAAYRSALWLEVRIHCLQKFDDECRRAAERYLNKLPTGRPAGVADEILKEISRGQ